MICLNPPFLAVCNKYFILKHITAIRSKTVFVQVQNDHIHSEWQNITIYGPAKLPTRDLMYKINWPFSPCPIRPPHMMPLGGRYHVKGDGGDAYRWSRHPVLVQISVNDFSGLISGNRWNLILPKGDLRSFLSMPNWQGFWRWQTTRIAPGMATLKILVHCDRKIVLSFLLMNFACTLDDAIMHCCCPLYKIAASLF